jgi:hypothetical protein
LAINEALIYLANAWSNEGVGLFDRQPERNLTIALDLALAQTILPRAEEALRSSVAMRRQLAGLRNSHFPHCTAWLESME